MIDFQWTDPVFSRRLCLTLMHSLWQVTLCAALAGIMARGLFKRSAEHAYRLHLAALLASLVALPVTYAYVQVSPEAVTSVVLSKKTEISRGVTAAHIRPDGSAHADGVSSEKPVSSLPSPEPIDSEVQTAGQVRVISGESASDKPESSWQEVAPWVALCYLGGIVIMVLRLVVSIARVTCLTHRCRRVTDGRLLELTKSLANRFSLKVVPVLMQVERAVVPQVIGLIRPVILFPASALTTLSVDELELILTHELAHVRRYDMWAMLLQRLAESLLFFNPALWYLSGRISRLREYSCDDAVCQTQIPAEHPVNVRYAQALIRVIELSRSGRSSDSQLATLAASGRSPSELRRRLARLLGEPLREPVRISWGGLLFCGMAVIGLLGGSSLIPGRNPTFVNAATPVDATAPTNSATRTFRLTVTGPDGKPVPNASCEIRDGANLKPEHILEGTFVRTGRYGSFAATGDQGQLALSLPRNLGHLHISIKHTGFGPFWAEWETSNGTAGIPDAATIMLENAWSVGGIVVDETGAPVVGAQVSPSVEYKKLPGSTQQLGVGAQVTTDAEGKWRYDLIPTSKDYVHVSINHQGYQPLRMQLPRKEYWLEANASLVKRLELKEGVSITGTVVDEKGRPIEQAVVRTKFMNEIREARTDKAGKYSIGGCEPKLTRIVAAAPGRAQELQEVLVDAGLKPVDFTLRRGGHVRIRVVDEQGKGLPKARIFFQQWRGQIDYFEFNGINQYTNADGVWEWNEAPLDEFKADICRPDGMQLSSRPITAREAEYVFSPPLALVVSGRIIDAVTKQPVLKYRVVPGTLDTEGLKGEFWYQRESFEATDGRYRIVRTTDAKAHRLRVEALGYKVARSRDIKSNEGTISIDLELQPAKVIAPTIVTPAGEPASGARLALGGVGEQISIKNGDFRDFSTYASRIVADEEGRFSMAERTEPFQLLIMHSAGFARLTQKDLPIPEKITLTPWAQVEGTYRIGNQPIANVEIAIESAGFYVPEDGPEQLTVSVETSGRTGPDGRYRIERVFPGKGYIGRNITFMVDDGATEVTSSQRYSAEYISGKTTQIDLGGKGRPVIGRLVPPTGHTKPVVWSFVTLSADPDIAVPAPPTPPADVGDDTLKYDAWLKKWLETSEGKAWTKAVQDAEAERGRYPDIRATAARDGSFRIDDMPAGDFVLSTSFMKDSPGTLSDHKFSVPAVVDGEVAVPVQLGDLILKKE